MKQDKKSCLPEEHPGRILMEAIRMQMASQGLSAAGAANACGLGYKYFAALMAGGRLFGHLKHENFRQIAKFLHTSVIQVMVWADAIGLNDFHVEEDLPYLLQVSYIKMRNDPHWGILLPSNDVWEKSHEDMKIALVLMYEHLVCEVLLEKIKVGPVTDLPALSQMQATKKQDATSRPQTKRKTP